MATQSAPLLSALILLPLLGAAVVAWQRRPVTARSVALAIAAGELLLSLAVLLGMDGADPAPQWQERYAWMPSLHVDYFLGVDGISAVFLPLTALLGLAVMLASWHTQRMAPLYFALLLALQGITMGVFCALDLALFFLFWELTLAPLYFLVSLWGIGPQRRFAATQYTLLMLAGGVPLLFGIVLLALDHAGGLGGELSFDYLELLRTPMAADTQGTVFLLLFLGFAVKAPLFPFHVWLPRMAMEGPGAVGALLVGLKLGAYGLLRLAVPLAPAGAHEYLPWVTALAVVGIVYGALLALVQTNLRRLLAFSSISHVGYVVLGIAACNLQCLQGAVFQLANFTVVAGGLFLLADALQQRLGTTELTGLGGIANSMPRFATLFMILGLAGMGLPGTSGFAAEHLIVLGAFRTDAGLGLLALSGAVLGAAYFLGYCRRALFGPVRNRPVAVLADLPPREFLLGALLAGLTLLAGLLPQPVLDASAASARQWVERSSAGP